MRGVNISNGGELNCTENRLDSGSDSFFLFSDSQRQVPAKSGGRKTRLNGASRVNRVPARLRNLGARGSPPRCGKVYEAKTTGFFFLKDQSVKFRRI